MKMFGEDKFPLRAPHSSVKAGNRIMEHGSALIECHKNILDMKALVETFK